MLVRIAIVLISILLWEGFLGSATENQTALASTLAEVASPESTQMSDEALRANIKDVINLANHSQQTLRDIITEVTRQDYVSVMQPNVIGSVVIPSVPTQIAVGDYLPPRPEYMHYFAQQSQSTIGMLIEAGLSLPGDWGDDKDLNTELALVKKNLEKLRLENASLQPLLVRSVYNNLAIGKKALPMTDQVTAIIKSLKKSEKRMEKYIKQSQK